MEESGVSRVEKEEVFCLLVSYKLREGSTFPFLYSIEQNIPEHCITISQSDNSPSALLTIAPQLKVCNGTRWPGC